MSRNPKAYTLTDPLDMEDARAAVRDLAEKREQALKDLEEAVEESAAAERDYRKALAVAFVTATGDTAAQKEANARKGAADDAYKRDLKAGMVKVAQERLNQIDGVRASLHRLIEWSQKINPTGEQREPTEPQPIYGSRAA